LALNHSTLKEKRFVHIISQTYYCTSTDIPG